MKIKYPNLTVFIIFFGLPLIEAVRGKNWLEMIVFLALGLMSFYADVKLDAWPWRRSSKMKK